MNSKWLSYTALIGFALAALLLVVAGFSYLFRTSEIYVSNEPPKVKVLPINGFAQGKEAYEAIGKDLLTLKFTPPKMELPDLRKLLTYYGPNARPDAHIDSNAVYFSLVNNKGMAPIAEEEKLYLLYDRNEKPPRYVFSPANSATTLWIEAEPGKEAATVYVNMVNEEGEIVSSPSDRAEFVLPQKEMTRIARGEPWQVGDQKVDGTLLARQKAKWYGNDRFFEKHGGEEYVSAAQKQRIDFGESDSAYSVFLSDGDILYWDGSKWSQAEPGPETIGKPLMQLKKMTDRILTFELWNEDGSQKMALNVLKSQERWSPEQLRDSFRFISARTRSQYIFEVGKERMTLSPRDWLVKTENGWEKLDTVEEIDDFVERKIQGPLFVFDGVEKKEDRQVLVGTLFNASRTEMKQIELDIPQSNVTVIRLPKGSPEAMSSSMRVWERR